MRLSAHQCDARGSRPPAASPASSRDPRTQDDVWRCIRAWRLRDWLDSEQVGLAGKVRRAEACFIQRGPGLFVQSVAAAGDAETLSQHLGVLALAAHALAEVR